MSNYGTNLRNIKNYAGGRGVVSKMTSSSASTRNAAVTNSNIFSDSSASGTNSGNIAALKAELNTYSKIAMDSADNLKLNGNKLLATGEESIFGNAESSGSTTVIVNKGIEFINDFNKVMSSIRKLGGEKNSEYIKTLTSYANSNSELLSKIGVTVLTDGSLTMNSNILREASLEDLKAVFNGKDSFAGKVSAISEEIHDNVETKLQENLAILAQNSIQMTQNSTSNLGKSSNSFFNMSI